MASMVLSTNIRLEPLAVEHIDGIMTWINDPEVTFYFARLGQTISRSDETKIVRGLIESKTDRIFSIFEGESYVGQIGLSQIYWPAKNARIGIMLRRNAWGRRIGRQAAHLLLRHAFDELGLHKLWLIIRSDNHKGRKIWSSMGFREEGILRDEYFVNETYFNMVRFGLLAHEYHRRSDISSVET